MKASSPAEPTEPTKALEDAARLAQFGDNGESTPAAGDDLGAKTARGAAVTIVGQFGQIALQMASIVILARLLTPHDYGLFGMILVVVGIGEIFRDFGLSAAAVQAKTLSVAQRDNLFWINAAVGILLGAVLFAGAPLVAGVFGQAELTPIARALCLIFVLNGLSTQYKADLSRRMMFTRLAGASLVGMLASLAAGIGFALAGVGYWALVASQLAQGTVYLLLLAISARWLPGRPTRHTPMRGFLRFGWNFLAGRLVYYISNNLDSLTIGVRFGPSPLGVYNRGYQMVMVPLNQFRVPISSVALPVFSRLQDDFVRAAEYLKRGQLAMGYTIVPGLALAAGACEPVVRLALGPQWTAVEPILALLAAAGAMQLLSFVGYWVYVSRGLTGALFRYTLVTASIKAALVLVGSQWGIVGVAAGFALAHLVEWPLSLWWLSKLTELPARALAFGAARLLVLAGAAGGLSYLAVHAVPADFPDILTLAVAAVTVIALYAICAAVFPQVRRDISDVFAIARRVVRRTG